MLSTQQNNIKNISPLKYLPETGNEIIQTAVNLLQTNDPDSAIMQLENFLLIEDENLALINCYLGIAFILKNDVEKAEQYLLNAIKLDPALVIAYYNLGFLYKNMGYYNKSLSFYKEVILIDGHDGEIYELMGDCCYSLNNYNDARSFYDAALKINPSSLNSAIHLAEIYLKSGNTTDAREVLKISLVSHPDKKELYYALGEIHKSLEEYETAIGNFRKVITIDENDSKAYMELGFCCYQLGLFNQALPLLAKAYKLDPMLTDSIFYLGKSYERKKVKDLAVSMYQKWVSIVEDHYNLKEEKFQKEFINICLYLSDYFNDLGDKDQSIFYKEKTLISDKSKNNDLIANTPKYNSSLLIDD